MRLWHVSFSEQKCDFMLRLEGGVEAFSIMSKKSFWIGGHDLHKISKWEWVDDSPWKYTKWDESK
jgi:hypothetical protein